MGSPKIRRSCSSPGVGRSQCGQNRKCCMATDFSSETDILQADLFIFVGRWSNQKGVDLIADVFFSVLKEHTSVQLICIGPVIDLYGKFAALKLSKLAKQFPGRVYSKPEFTMLPPYIFSGAEFALMPSRDEPFGLVAVEFGRKGALCVGSRVGGFGHMPGWWFTVESITSKHLMSQFKAAIKEALASDKETRALMRAYSKMQRFPVAQWVEDLEKLQAKSIATFDKIKYRADHSIKHSISSASFVSGLRSGRSTPRPSSDLSTPIRNTPSMTPSGSRAVSRAGSPFHSRTHSRATSTSRNDSPADIRSLADSPTPASGAMRGRGHPQAHKRSGSMPRYLAWPLPEAPPMPDLNTLDEQVRARLPSSMRGTPRVMSPTMSVQFDLPDQEDITDELHGTDSFDLSSYRRLSLDSISRGVETNSTLQILSPLFDDKRSVYYNQYSEKLDKHLDARSSEGDLCIEEYLMRSEKKWFNNYHTASLRTGTPNSTSSLIKSERPKKSFWKSKEQDAETREKASVASEYDQYFDSTYSAPRGAKMILQRKIGSWPIYCFLLALVSNAREILLFITNFTPGPNSLSQFLPTHATHWLSRPTRKQALRARIDLPRQHNFLVDALPQSAICIYSLNAVSIFRLRVLPPRTSRCHQRLYYYRLDIQCRGRDLCDRISIRNYVLRT